MAGFPWKAPARIWSKDEPAFWPRMYTDSHSPPAGRGSVRICGWAARAASRSASMKGILACGRFLDGPGPGGYARQPVSAVFLFLLAAALVVAIVQGTVEKLTAGALSGATSAVTLAIGLVGVMALWLGLLKVAEEAGLVRALGRLVRPVMRRLFPDVPA